MERWRIPAVLVATAILATACADADPSWPVTSAAPSASLAALSAGQGGIVLTIAPGSKAVVRVREQLANLVSPSDAVLSSDSVSGRIAMRRDGTFVTGSRITVSLDDLRSDNAQRDRFIKQETLNTKAFPYAEFIPVKATGISLPLRAEGEVSFKVAGTMTIHGTTRDVTFDVSVARTPREILITGRSAPAWRFADFGLDIPRVFSVLSIVDEIRVEVQLLASEGSG